MKNVQGQSGDVQSSGRIELYSSNESIVSNEFVAMGAKKASFHESGMFFSFGKGIPVCVLSAGKPLVYSQSSNLYV